MPDLKRCQYVVWLSTCGFASSAEGAEYESQGQVRTRSGARRPWLTIQKRSQGLKGRNNRHRITPFQGYPASL